MERLDALNDLLAEVLNDYGWAPDMLFTDPSKVDEYKDIYITAYRKLYCHLPEYQDASIDILARVESI